MYLLKKRIPYYLSILYIHLKEYFLMTSLRARKIEFPRKFDVSLFNSTSERGINPLKIIAIMTMMMKYSTAFEKGKDLDNGIVQTVAAFKNNIR